MKKCTFLLAAALPLAGAGVAGAAMTSFNTQTLADTGSNLDNRTGTGGAVLAAINFTNTAQSSPVTNPTINGIPFTAFNVPSTASVSGTNFTLTSNSTNPLIRDDNRPSGRPTTADIYPLIYNAIVSPVATGTPAASVMTLTLQSLSPGQQYEIQMVYSSDATARQVTVNDAASSAATPGTSGAVSYGTTNGPRVVTGLFTADATSQAYDIVATTSGTRVQFSGFTLQTVPEPSAAAVVLVGGGLLALRRRRRAVGA